jgi:hypothetical protein
MRSKKQLLLINPPANADVGKQLHLENLGLGFVAAAVRRELGHSHEVHLWDCSLVDPTGKFIRQLLQKLSPGVVGLSLSTMNANEGERIARLIKAFDPSIRILLGGILPTCLQTEELLRFCPDAILRGEGEGLVAGVLTALDSPRPSGSAEVLEVSQDVPLDVDSLGWPARDMLPWQLRLHPQTSISASRGCPYRCSFCSIPQPGGKKIWRPRAIEDVVAEMECIHHHYHSSHFYFVDDNFVLNTPKARQRAEQFAHLVLEKLPDIRFGFMCRSAAIEASLFKLLKKAGLAGVFLGIESFSQAVLDRYRKQETVEEHIAAITTLNDLGITVNPGFIFFDQWTRTSEINETIDVMKGIHFQALESMNSKLTCYKGSAIADEILENHDEAPSLGIKKYAIADAAVQGLFHQCCTVFYDLLPTREHYAAYQRNSYCMGYLLPYFLNSGREALFLKYYTESHEAWKQGDNMVMQFLQDSTNQTPGRDAALEPMLTDRIEPLWKRGNEAAERFFRLARIVLVNQMGQESLSRVRLTALAFTSLRSDLDMDVLFANAHSVRPENRVVLAESMAQYKGRDAGKNFRFLLAQNNDAVASLALDAAERLFYRPIVALAEDYVARQGQDASPAFAEAVCQAKRLFQLSYPEYILTYGRQFPSGRPDGPETVGRV